MAFRAVSEEEEDCRAAKRARTGVAPRRVQAREAEAARKVREVERRSCPRTYVMGDKDLFEQWRELFLEIAQVWGDLPGDFELRPVVADPAGPDDRQEEPASEDESEDTKEEEQ